MSSKGVVISRYGDSIYDYSTYAGKPLRVAFFNDRSSRYNLDSYHYELLRIFLAYCQFVHHKRLGFRTMVGKFELLKKAMHFCISRKVNFDELSRYPRVCEEFAIWHVGLGASAGKLSSILSDIFHARNMLGFHGPDIGYLSTMNALISLDEPSEQTPYIPTRIWDYQCNRLEYFLDSFLSRKQSFIDLFNTMLDAYVTNAGSIEKACRSGALKSLSPFRQVNPTGKVKFGTFTSIASEYGVLSCIRELICSADEKPFSSNAGAKPFGRYFNAISFVAQAFLVAFSGMRISEAATLRKDCIEVESVEGWGDVYYLRAMTKKTIDDPSALWITSEVSRKAVEVLSIISDLRMSVMQMDSRISLSADDIANPFLVVYGVEPWLPSKTKNAERDINVRSWLPYRFWKKVSPGLFLHSEILIRESDLDESLQVSPDLDLKVFSVGKEWMFAYHQLRRTLMVNSSRYGLVSGYSQQYQMKHLYQAMSTYYGKGGGGLSLNQDIQYSFVEEVYRQIAASAKELVSDSFFSPLGDKHTESMIQLFAKADLVQLVKKAKAGEFKIRQTLIGVCLSKTFCSLGGVDNLVDCGSCHEALVDKRNLSFVVGFLKNVSYILPDIDEGTPAYQSLDKQRVVASKLIEAINVRS
ncbi:hypothetical protein GIV63_26670 [Pseudomonas sp. PA-3-10C]|uniref:hypothetical protein n=1 Tax=unclassified Pseudomonas TaxID=196821 RepID=UPI001F206348|nr:MULTISPECIES: hypothetical protein [unclassified Pseudomonas]MCF5564878.1 hypothetical protein [Pseudomonas sp. PA-3-5D]MCF5596609.1 hypothetical protein [Pseudomonas sp. PA-3-10C]